MPRNSLPSVTSDIPKDLRYFIDRVGEIISENGADRFVTLTELKGAGVYGGGGGGGDDGGGGGGGGGGDDGTTEIPVLTPPKPEGLVASGGYEYIILDWTRPTYYGHQFTTVYYAEGLGASFEDATAVTDVEGRAAVFSHYLGTGQSATYWIRYTNINGGEGPLSDPADATTAINVEEVIDVLTGTLTSTAFVDYLSTYLDSAPSNFVVKLAGDDGSAAGFGLAQVSRNGGVEFDFAILADNFFISPPIDYNQVATPAENPPAVGEGAVWRQPPPDYLPPTYYIWDGSTWVIQPSEPAQTPAYFQTEEPPAGSPVGTVWRKTGNKGTGFAKYYVWKNVGGWVEIDALPFIVRTTDTTLTNEDGKTIDVPAGVYIRSAFIQDGTITNAKIGTASIDNAKIIDATIDTAKIAYLDAGKIRTGNLESFDFTNTPGKAGFRLAINSRAIYNNGVFTGQFESLSSQEDIEFILRGALDNSPALQLINGVVTINALNIRNKLESLGYASGGPGFSFDVDTGVFAFKDADGNIIFTTNGVDGDAILAAIDGTINDLQDDIDSRATQTAFNNLVDDVTAVQDGLTTKAEQADLTTTNTNLTTLNTELDSVRDPTTGLLDPSKLTVNIINNDAQLLSDLEFLRPFAEEGELELFFSRAAFAQLIAGTLISDQLFVNTGNFGTVLTNTVLANNGTIDNLLVNTLQIADDAVTVPVGGNVTPGVQISAPSQFDDGFNEVARTSPITWDNSDASTKPKAIIIVGTMNFVSQQTGGDTGVRLRLMAQGPNNTVEIQTAAVSANVGLSQVVTVSAKFDLSERNSPHSFILEARSDDTDGDYITGSGNIFALASKR